ncbi:hydroxyacylglutathione hydrolase [Limimaricola soesokkakensis]|uniref:Hydroxyacylglutathione hydrolase n=1 Tax=Limimaricola soesokkakensis TaxID=1343159 RepID=A0A1X7A359_9RHOB|nr:rhodanese-like domain-containing protein [Limimaricola soesokkakensis]PSK80971.1 hydroxyacylglutathione hydrolase [Limimaricola soesokkakensis]SLN69259.1 putative polyketide biosynthesis zinc-dependent hydrolase BaeB [Limimaricola soesokkakensis]
MTLRFEQILADGVAECSYLLGDDAAHVCAVVDPRPDVDIYLEAARRFGLAITHVFETHIHADFMSGARELVDRLGGQAKLYVSTEGGAEYGFDHETVRDGDEFRFGGLRMKARFTPGHTPEHMSYFLYDGDTETPWGVLSGDAFFVDSVGRPDLMGDDQTEELTEKLFHTVRDVFMALPDDVIIYPCHGAGSACGPDIGDRMSSTIGYERRFNDYAKIESLEEFKKVMQTDAPPVPTHYPRLKKVNAKGPEVLRNLPRVPPLTVERFAKATEGGAQIVDTRDMMDFGAGHVKGSLNIGARPELSVWAGWLLDPEKPIYLVLHEDADLPGVVKLLWRTGFTEFGGYLAGGMSAWREAGRDFAQIPQISVHELKDAQDITPLDVRKPDEWEGGHLPGATHAFLGELREKMSDLDRSKSYATYCASGFRASIAASLLAAHGFETIRNVPGSWKAWSAAGYPVETPEQK